MRWCFVVSVSSRAAVAFCCCQLPDSYVISLFGLDVWFTWHYSQRQTGVETSFFAFSYLEFHEPYMFPTLKAHQVLEMWHYMFPTLKAHQVLEMCPFFWCRARTSYVFKSILSLTKDSSEQDTRGHRRTATSMHQRDKTPHSTCKQRFLCCYAWCVSSSML